MPKYAVIALVLCCGLLGATAQILFKSASGQLALSLPGLLNPKLLGGIALYFVAMVLFLCALRFGDVSKLYPLIASSYVFAAILAHFVLHEKISAPTIAGIALVVLGITVLTTQVK